MSTQPSTTSTIAAPSAFLTEKDAAFYIGMSIHFLRQNRHRGRGPAYARLGRAIRYRRDDLETWLRQSTVKPRR